MKNFGYSAIGIVLGIIIGFFLFHKTIKAPIYTGKPNIDTAWMPGIPDTMFVPKPYKVTQYTDTGSMRLMPVDTAAILWDYFTMKWYSDTLKNDSVAFASVESIVTSNELQRIQFVFQSRLPPCLPCPPSPSQVNNRYSLSVGATIGRSARSFGFGPIVSLGVKKLSFGAFYDITNKDTYVFVTHKIK